MNTHHLALYGSAVLTTLLFLGIIIGLNGISKAQEGPLITNELCQEVETELNRAVDEGFITTTQAETATTRCYNAITGGQS